ncbi:ribonuclease [Faecalimonas umbilicata]|nr:ribonuclease [Faecalimonas umbilicata]
MDMEILLQFVTYALTAVGVLAFLASIITQVIKEMPVLKGIQTNVVALVVALVLCPVAVIVACQYFKIVIEWYYIFASFIAASIVYLVSTGGWERVSEMWSRTKYNKNT